MSTIVRDVPDTAAEQVRELLAGFNRSIAGDDSHEPLRLVVVNDDEVVGGLLGGTYWGYLHVDILVVAESERGRGTGTRLLLEAERTAIGRGCKHACLETHDFQNTDFYMKRGYKVVGELPDLPPGHVKYLMHKELV